MSNSQSDASIEKAFELAKERYASLGVDVGNVLSKLKTVPISMHCWQGDDVQGFELDGGDLSGGIAVTGNHPGKARNADELRMDLEKSFTLIPGKHRLNLHAIYGQFLTPTDRDQVGPEHFQGWIDWAREQEIGMDFNPSFFSHPNASDGFTLSHADEGIRNFWIDHGIASRRIGEEIGKALGSPCVTNFWVPDGYKDTPADRLAPRERLAASLDKIFETDISPKHNLDAVECKLFGIGSESYVVGSHEFYLGYAMSRKKLLCLDAGHFHPTEIISDKLSSVLMYLPEILLHVSRGVRWDSDHVVTYSDELQAIAHEIVRQNYLDRVHIGLDFFDGSINRVAAWVIGTRNMLKALLKAMLEPVDQLKTFENADDLTSRLALMEELKLMPLGAVWDYYCLVSGVPAAMQWLEIVKQYEQDVQLNRSSVSEKV